MKYRSLVVLFLLSFLFPPEALPAEDAKSAEVLPLLIQIALANNPELKASQSEQSLESATIGYQVNKVDFLTLLDNRTTLFNYEREYYDLLADYQMKLAQLEALVEALVGKELQ